MIKENKSTFLEEFLARKSGDVLTSVFVIVPRPISC